MNNTTTYIYVIISLISISILIYLLVKCNQKQISTYEKNTFTSQNNTKQIDTQPVMEILITNGDPDVMIDTGSTARRASEGGSPGSPNNVPTPPSSTCNGTNCDGWKQCVCKGSGKWCESRDNLDKSYRDGKTEFQTFKKLDGNFWFQREANAI
jgi:hypothetical protein